ncbi:MAG: hypothetical protein IPH89_09735 [Bacteroidetes bacterium]|nr:hypothetical protein [Bacteroidota bacterium]
MKSYLIILSIVVSIFTSCKTKETTTSSTMGKTSGKVSHEYKAGGCSAVIVTSDGITLIPKDALKKEFDVDGLEVTFDYLTLKMPQPAGCTTGMPAEITNLGKVKK